MMRTTYAQLRACRRIFILNYFDEKYSSPRCGNCNNCCDQDSSCFGSAEVAPFPIQSRVQHQEWGEGTVLHDEADKFWVLFDTVGNKTLALALVVENDLLQPVD